MGKDIMAKPKIVLYFDIVSPFAYLAFHILKKAPVFKQCEVSFIPIHLGTLMRMTGNSPPTMVKNKDKRIDRERLRWAKRFDIPTTDQIPDGFPVKTKTLPIQRTLVSLSLSHPADLDRATTLFYENFWQEYRAPCETENLLSIFKTIVGSSEEAQRVFDGTQDEQVKKKLTENTDRAFNDGAFGLPWFAATTTTGESEVYWGVDRIGEMCDFLKIERPDEMAQRAML